MKSTYVKQCEVRAELLRFMYNVMLPNDFCINSISDSVHKQIDE